MLAGSWDPFSSPQPQKVTAVWDPCSASPAEGQPASTWVLRAPGHGKPSIPQPRRQEWAGDTESQGPRWTRRKFIHPLACSCMYLIFLSFQQIAPGSVLGAGIQQHAQRSVPTALAPDEDRENSMCPHQQVGVTGTSGGRGRWVLAQAKCGRGWVCPQRDEAIGRVTQGMDPHST